MNGICGWVGWDEPLECQRHTLDRMADRLAPWGRNNIRRALANQAAVAISTWTAGPQIHEEDGYWIIVLGDARFSNRPSRRQNNSQEQARAILDAFRDRQQAMLEDLRGGYALAIISQRGGDSLLAIDRIGGRFPLSYRIANDALVFATHSSALTAHPLCRSGLDLQSIYNYLYLHVTPSPRSIRMGVRQLLPAGYILIRNGTTRVGTHWQASYRDDGSVSLPGMCEEFRELVRKSIDLHAQGAEVGCFLSGGTDSSTLAGFLRHVTGSPARTYSIGFDAKGYDEMEYARIAARAFQTDHHEYYLTPQDVMNAIPNVALAYSEPFGNASAVPTYYCARLAHDDGIERMLGGDGGDELFAGNKRYSEQHVFGLYQRLPLLARRFLETVVLRLLRNTEVTPVRKTRSYIEQAAIPMPHRLQSYNYLERVGADTMIHPDLLSVVDVNEPRALQAQVYASAQAESMLNRMLALDLKFTLADDDLPKVSQMCRMAGVDVAYPLLSDEMVEFSCKLPARLKLKRLRLRWFMKHALRDFLPEEILRKRKHGFGLPFGIWMRDHPPLREFVRANLEQLKTRDLVRPAYVDRVLRLHETVHATYYGVVIWVLMMLEQWFQQHEE